VIPGSVNPNVPPDLPQPPSTDPIDLRREQEEKERELEAQKKAEEKDRQNATRPASAAADTPIKKALLELRLHNFDKSLSQLNEIIATNPKNAEAHYLRAVIFVLTRKYDAASNEYRLVLKNDPSPTLAQKARNGLIKLAR
jgi:tetratricopeptide (TPR) repeat protein